MFSSVRSYVKLSEADTEFHKIQMLALLLATYQSTEKSKKQKSKQITHVVLLNISVDYLLSKRLQQREKDVVDYM